MGRVKKWLSDQPLYPVVKISTSFVLSFFFFIFSLFNCLVLLFGHYCKAYVAFFCLPDEKENGKFSCKLNLVLTAKIRS